jgi:single-stranded DNA-specific DHH superfamily exonuclease
MLPKEQILEIRNYLKKSENPLFLYDDDPDGMSSYLLLKKYIDRGMGAVVKAEPVVSEKYLRKVKEYSPDYVFILDIPMVDQDFIDKVNVPIIWLDHHPPVIRKGVHYYNPMLNEPKDNRPTTYYAYKIAEEQNTWIAAVGTFGDWHFPDFTDKIKKLYPGLIPDGLTKPEQVLFNSKLGELIQIISLLLKLSTTQINLSSKILLNIENPFEILNESTAKGKYIYRKTKKLVKRYKEVMKEMPKSLDGNLLFIKHPKTKNAFTSELSNELCYRTQKIIMIAREDRGRMKISMRSPKKNIQKVVKEALIGLSGYGGGHELACGANISEKDFPEFLLRFKKLIK